MYQSRWTSPVVWIGVLTVFIAQAKMLQESGVNPFTMSIAIATIGIAFFMGINNPENKEGL